MADDKVPLGVVDVFTITPVGDDRAPLHVVHVVRLDEEFDPPERGEAFVHINEATYERISAALDGCPEDEGVAVDVHEDDLIPAYEFRPCPLCEEPDQLVVSSLQVTFVTVECEGCNEPISASTVPPEMQDTIDTALRAFEEVSGQPFFGGGGS